VICPPPGPGKSHIDPLGRLRIHASSCVRTSEDITVEVGEFDDEKTAPGWQPPG